MRTHGSHCTSVKHVMHMSVSTEELKRTLEIIYRNMGTVFCSTKNATGDEGYTFAEVVDNLWRMVRLSSSFIIYD